MRTTMVIGIVLMSLACVSPVAAAEDAASDVEEELEVFAGCIVIDPTSMPPVRTEPCAVGP